MGANILTRLSRDEMGELQIETDSETANHPPLGYPESDHGLEEPTAAWAMACREVI